MKGKMKNRAKCKLCNTIIESFHSTDYVICKCDEIAVDGGDALLCYAKDFSNFLRVDDEGNEIIVKEKVPETTKSSTELSGRQGPYLVNEQKPPTPRDELIKELEGMIQTIENLPERALYQPVTQCELASVLMLLSAILRS